MNTHTYTHFTKFIECAAKFVSLVAAATFSQGAAN
jgi:hypothetical protein